MRKSSNKVLLLGQTILQQAYVFGQFSNTLILLDQSILSWLMLPSQKTLQQLFVARSDNPPQACFAWSIQHLDVEPVASIDSHVHVCYSLYTNHPRKYGK